MKKLYLVIGIGVILALVCSPALAISKADLISQYKGQSSPMMPIPTPTVMPTQIPRYDPSVYPLPSMPIPTPTATPTAVPTQAPSNWPYPIVPDIYIKTKSSYHDSLSEIFSKKWEEWIFSDDTAVSGKPNIYLYSDQDLPARVRLAPEYAITISDPVYRPGTGWLAEIRNGSLNEAGDFLFYEAVVPAFGWQKEEGYVIRAEYREQDMASMLGHYGFNEKETVEFIDYWANHLVEDTDFVFYPQETEAVNRDMPLTIRPKPDHVMRIWYYAEPLVSAPEPVMSPERIVREGFYVVEWGVIITNEEYWINRSPASPKVLI